MIVPEYYYVIVGGGLAGLQLAMEIKNDVFFRGKKIAIIDPSPKTENDKTWCFWEQGKGQWEDVIYKSWGKGKFCTSESEILLDLGAYTYKMIRAADFYSYVKKQLQNSDHFTFIEDEIEKIDPVTRTAIGKKSEYTATHFFDSRPGKAYEKDPDSTLIYQHFKGWMISTDRAHFNMEEFTMMDYRIKYNDATSFTYVLPITPKKALVEFTFFTPYLTEDKIYNNLLESYIRDILKIDKYSITETEKGIIPMTDYPFHKSSSRYITKIGTAGGWVKASSGYSFKNTEKKVKRVIYNIKAGLPAASKLQSRKFRRYDSIFLDVLFRNNQLGERLFTRFYSKNSIERIFRFLDEETALNEEIKIMASLYHPEFIKSFFRKL